MTNITEAESANDARKAEAKADEAKPVTFTHDDRVYTIAPDAVNNLELFEAVEDEKYLTAIRGFLGRRQWDQFKDDHRDEGGIVRMEPVEGFLQALMGALGAGN